MHSLPSAKSDSIKLYSSIYTLQRDSKTEQLRYHNLSRQKNTMWYYNIILPKQKETKIGSSKNKFKILDNKNTKHKFGQKNAPAITK